MESRRTSKTVPDGVQTVSHFERQPCFFLSIAPMAKDHRLYCISSVISSEPKPFAQQTNAKEQARQNLSGSSLPKAATRARFLQTEVGSCPMLLQTYAGSGRCPGLCLTSSLFGLLLFILCKTICKTQMLPTSAS